MNVIDTAIADVKIIEPKVFGDQRGFFLESFHQARYQEMLNIDLPFVQDNHSRSAKQVLRGLHFQKTKPQGKLVRVIQGAVFDVAVDIRRNSPTYGKWVGEILSADNFRQMWVPPELAHGFLVLSESADFEYKCTAFYDPTDEGCLAWNDPTVAVEWPLVNPILSAKDQVGRLLGELDD